MSSTVPASTPIAVIALSTLSLARPAAAGDRLGRPLGCGVLN